MDDQRLESLTTVKDLSAGQRSSLLENGKRSVISKGTVLEPFDERNWHLHLVDGRIKFYPSDGKAYTFDDSEERALEPVFSDVRGKESAKFIRDSLVIRFDRKQVEQAAQTCEQLVAVHDVQITEVGADVLRSLFEDFHNGGISVPAMPAVAVRVRALVDDENATTTQVAELIEQDPSLAGKLVAAANSAGIRGRTEIVSVGDGLSRMGLSRAVSVVISLAVQQMFTFRSRPLFAAGSKIWAQATQVAATCRVLAQHMNHPDIDVEKAFMIGLLHNVGAVAVLGYLENADQEVSEDAALQTLHNLRAVSTTLVLNKWHMDDDFHVAGEDAEEQQTQANPYFPLLELAISQVQLIHHKTPAENNAVLSGLRMLGDHQATDEAGRLLIIKDHPELSNMADTPGVENAA
ncbi:MAG: HDOD domain-containing protein [Lysobacterales bacterium]